MIFFIEKSKLAPYQYYLFQFIKWYSLSEDLGWNVDNGLIFQFIKWYSLSDDNTAINVGVEKFQFIKWYSLSKSFWKKNMTLVNFNSSNDILYQEIEKRRLYDYLFQFIKWYSLSHWVFISKMFQIRFQFIKWYSLSSSPCVIKGGDWDFNSSNDILYQVISTIIWVTKLFQFIKWYSLSIYWSVREELMKISIHQMIFFIQS